MEFFYIAFCAFATVMSYATAFSLVIIGKESVIQGVCGGLIFVGLSFSSVCFSGLLFLGLHFFF